MSSVHKLPIQSRGWLSSFGQLLLTRFSLWTIWGRKTWSWSIGVVCAKRMRSLLIICFFIVSVHNSYGTPFSLILAWRGLSSWGCESFAVLVVRGSLLKCRGWENGPVLYHVVSMVQTKWEIFRGFQKKLGGSFTFFSHYPLHLGGSLAYPSCDYFFWFSSSLL